MTMEKTKAQLTHLLADKDNKVIALTGKWGTGKSYLWNEVKNESKDDAVKNALYVSLFGLNGMNQVKSMLLQCAYPTSMALKDGMQKLLGAVGKKANGIDELALFALPSVLKDKVIVFDDIERKHEKLHIDEILGFIDEYTQQKGARFVLIFNSDKLVDVDLWNTFREKVVDQEIRLSTSPSEAFDIAIKLSPSDFENNIQQASELCGLTNIRIIKKVINVVNKILVNIKKPSNPLLRRIIPSTVLLSATHYKGIVDGPDLNFILKYNLIPDFSKKDARDDDVSKQNLRWRSLFQSLGINYCDDYELLVFNYLQTGLLDECILNDIINNITNNNHQLNITNQVRDFLLDVSWNSKLSDNELIKKAEAIGNISNQLDAQYITFLCDAVKQLEGGVSIADKIINSWLLTFIPENHPNLINFKKNYGHELNDKIKSKLEDCKTKTKNSIHLSQALLSITNNNWGGDVIEVIDSANVSDFERAIKTLDRNNLENVMGLMIKTIKTPDSYPKEISKNSEKFYSALENIVKDNNSGRLGKIIQREFGKINRNDLLTQDIPSNT